MSTKGEHKFFLSLKISLSDRLESVWTSQANDPFIQRDLPHAEKNAFCFSYQKTSYLEFLSLYLTSVYFLPHLAYDYLQTIVKCCSGMALRDRGVREEMLPGNNQIRGGGACSCIMGRERNSERNLPNLKETVGDLYLQICKILLILYSLTIK